jgi:hypothetical protein
MSSIRQSPTGRPGNPDTVPSALRRQCEQHRYRGHRGLRRATMASDLYAPCEGQTTIFDQPETETTKEDGRA